MTLPLDHNGDPGLTERAVRDCLSLLPTGVAVVTALAESGERLGPMGLRGETPLLSDSLTILECEPHASVRPRGPLVFLRGDDPRPELMGYIGMPAHDRPSVQGGAWLP